jgi:hypothetical protein
VLANGGAAPRRKKIVLPGCQSKHHVHVSRKDSSGNTYNFVIPGCVNSPTPMNWYDDPEGAVYDNDDDEDS